MRSLGTLYAAAVTPLTSDDQLDLAGVAPLLHHLAATGCDGALLAGTTGEGPSLTAKERSALFEHALSVRPEGLRLIASTGDSALPNTLALTRRAYDLGMDGVLIMPPFYFKTLSPTGLLETYRRIFHEAVPSGARVLLYHIPQLSGIALTHDLLEALLREFPDRLIGVKDSQGDRAHTLDWCRRFRQLTIFVGHDALLSAALGVGAAGAILATANVYAPLARKLLDAHRTGADTTEWQARLDAARASFANLDAVTAAKALLADYYGLPDSDHPWAPRLPLCALPPATRQALHQTAVALLDAPDPAPDPAPV